MNTLLSPLPMVLLQWTALLALGWAAHGFLRQRHPRARLILWRGLLCFSLLVPFTQFAPIALIHIPVDQAPAPELADNLPPVADTKTVSNSNVKPIASVPVKPVNVDIKNSPASPTPIPAKKIPWLTLLFVAWATLTAFSCLRLVLFQLQLNRLRHESRPASPALQEQVRSIQVALGIKKKIGVWVSGSITAPFVCGLLNPAILLPQTLSNDLSDDETSTLLVHEMAHFRHNDLFWCIGWRWMQALFWFHPLVWEIPAVHSLACEQEADRIAAGRWEDGRSYSQLLARLALRVLTLSKPETHLALGGTAQITRRLKFLKRGTAGHWDWKYSTLVMVLVGLLFVTIIGCRVDNGTTSTSGKTEFKNVLVVVEDEDGKPIEAATVSPRGFRVKGIHGADAYPWRKDKFGPPGNALTDGQGKAYVKYPVEGIPDEKEFTGALILNVYHPGFAAADIQTYQVDGSEKPVQLQRAAYLEVSAYFGAQHQPVTDLVPIIVPDSSYTNENGILTFDTLAPGGHLIQLMGRLPSGEIVYSTATAFTSVGGKLGSLSLEMKPGIRLEGRIDDNVPPPVKNGRVIISVRAPQYPANDIIEDYYAHDDNYGGYMARVFWHSYRPINADGTFVFESVPPGEADIVALGDGFVSQTVGKLHNRINGIISTNSLTMSIPQAFPLTTPVTQIVVKTEPTATLEFSAVTKSGQPIEGIWVGMYPEVFRMWGPFAWKKDSSEEPFRQIPHLPDLGFSGKTDSDGKLVLANLPPEVRGLDIDSQDYQVPLQQPKSWRDRHVRARFSPGETNELHMVMERKGSDFIGTAR